MVKIEDFISRDELNSMSVREREIAEQVFELKKEELQKWTDALKIAEENQL